MGPWELSEGGYIRITFTQPLTGAASENESSFTVSWQEYDYVPGGTLVNKSASPTATRLGESEYELVLEMAWNQRFLNAVGQIAVAYDGSGTLQGVGGAVEPFEVMFLPHDLVAKPNQHPVEHIEIADIAATSELTRIYYTDAKSDESIQIADIAATAILTDIGDL